VGAPEHIHDFEGGGVQIQVTVTSGVLIVSGMNPHVAVRRLDFEADYAVALIPVSIYLKRKVCVGVVGIVVVTNERNSDELGLSGLSHII